MGHLEETHYLRDSFETLYLMSKISSKKHRHEVFFLSWRVVRAQPCVKAEHFRSLGRFEANPNRESLMNFLLTVLSLLTLTMGVQKSLTSGIECLKGLRKDSHRVNQKDKIHAKF